MMLHFFSLSVTIVIGSNVSSAFDLIKVGPITIAKFCEFILLYISFVAVCLKCLQIISKISLLSKGNCDIANCKDDITSSRRCAPNLQKEQQQKLSFGDGAFSKQKQTLRRHECRIEVERDNWRI